MTLTITSQRLSQESDGGRNVEDCVRRARRKFLTKVMKDGNGEIERGDCGEEKEDGMTNIQQEQQKERRG